MPAYRIVQPGWRNLSNRLSHSHTVNTQAREDHGWWSIKPVHNRKAMLNFMSIWLFIMLLAKSPSCGVIVSFLHVPLFVNPSPAAGFL
jgi:uncharacterized protein YbbK (DUF523 family)